MEASIENKLKGNEFISDKAKTIYGDEVPRSCTNCFYGVDGDLNYKGKCLAIKISNLFGEEIVTENLDGKETAHYCKYYTHWSFVGD